MSMERVTLRLPPALVRAYDSADGNRSALMRRVLREAVEDGELVTGVDDDLVTLATVEGYVDEGRLRRRRGTFRKRFAQFAQEKYASGYVTGDEMDDMADSWRSEAALYGTEPLAWVETVVSWYRENWSPDPYERTDWPDPATFHRRMDPSSVDVSDRLVTVMRDAKDDGLPRGEAVRRVSKFHPDERVRAAAEVAYSSAATDGGGE